MIEIKISAINADELKQILKSLIGNEVVNVEKAVPTEYPVTFIEPDVHVSDNNVEDDELDERDPIPVEKPAKKAKAAKAPKVEASPAPVVETAVPVAPPVATDEPKNFYSLAEFNANFVMIFNELLSSGVIDQIYVNILTNVADCHFIYAAAKDPAKVELVYEKMITDGVITRKGSY